MASVTYSQTKMKAKTIQPEGVPGTGRIDALSDGVFAIVITLLVLELKVPEIESHLVSEQLLVALLGIFPRALSHVVSFFVLGIYWVGHHNMFLLIQRHNRVLLWLNILFLLSVASMPFPTGLLVQYNQERWAIILYALTLVAAGLTLSLIWWYATTNRRLVNPEMTQEFVSFVHRRVLIAPVAYMIAILFSFISLNAAKVIFILTALYYIFPNPFDHHHHRETVQVDELES